MVNMTCIICPVGCSLSAETDENGAIHVTGNGCPRGAKYAESELTHPVRTLTDIVRLTNRDVMLSVKSSGPLPKELLLKAAEFLAGVSAAAPVNIGDVIVSDILGTGVDIVATKEID